MFLKHPLFPKIKSFLAHLALTSLLLTIFLFILSKIGFSLGLDRPQIGRLTLYLVLLATLINVGKIKAAIDKALAPKKRERFIFFTLANVFLTLAFLVGYAIFQYGSPLIYENHPQGFRAVKEVPLVENTIISQEFKADSNNLGTVGVRLSVQEKTLGFDEEGEIIEIKPKKEIEEEMVDEEPQEEPATGQGELAEDEEEPIEEITHYEPAEIIFRIKEKGTGEWFYENSYFFDQTAPTHLYPFGFPVIENSESKTYLVEIEGQKPIAPEENNLYLFAPVNKNNQPYLYSRYVYNKGELKENIGPILENTLRKIALVFKNEETILIIIVHLITSSILIAGSFKKQLFNTTLQYSFLIFLFFLSIHQFLPKIFPDYHWGNSILKPYFAITTTVLGLVLVFKNREKIEKGVLEEEAEEEREEREKFSKFPKKFPLLAKIPILKNIFSWVYSQGLWSIIGLLIILTIFTLVKAPYFGVSFTGEHTMKYNTYVEPAKYMYEKNNPFWMQRKYQADPVNNPEGIFNNFGSLPLNEWGLFLTYKLFPNNSIEFNTRLFTHFLGIIILVSAFVFFSEWFSQKLALLITFLISINPIINFTSFVTVEDSWLIIFTLLSLIYLTKYFKKEKSMDLFLSGIFFGLGNICKFSIFLWLFPIIILITYLIQKKPIKVIKSISVVTFISLIVIIAFRTSLSQLPNNLLPSLLKSILWVFIFNIFYLLFKKFDKQIENGIGYLLNKKILLFFTITAALTFSIIFIYINNLNYFFSEFLTDFTLIFNWKMYVHMLNQFKTYMTNGVFGLGLLGFLFTLIAGSKKQKNILLSFLFGSLVYWIAASKAMFFHNYYTAIIMICFCISSGSLLFMFYKTTSKSLFPTILLIVILSMVFLPSYSDNTLRLKKEENSVFFNEACNYLIENTTENESYIDGNFVLALTICSGRPAIDRSRFENETIRKSITEIGLTETMKKFKIKYLITKNEEINYIWLANLYSPDLSAISHRRHDLIISKIEGRDLFEDKEKREEIIEKENINSKILLEKEIGPYKFYSFY